MEIKFRVKLFKEKKFGSSLCQNVHRYETLLIFLQGISLEVKCQIWVELPVKYYQPLP